MTEAKSTLENIVRSAKLEVAGKHVFSDFLSADEKQMKLPQIENEILPRSRKRCARQLRHRSPSLSKSKASNCRSATPRASLTG